ncbi:MAG: SDR family oxidoreductase [Chromatiales bacterium]|jgi:NAD(P)-dependent dehydrogenase (short-subunit alcohol dehydrogenase family)|nr:SDR family oxidoreductase [Chromatiales bacterium]
MQVQDKVVLITGGGSGIGAESARYLTARGARVAIAGIEMDGVHRVAEEVGGLALKMDVRKEESVAAGVKLATEHFGRLDAVVANAGIQRHNTDRDLFRLSEEEWQLTQDVNLAGVMRTCKAALGQMIDQGDGGAVVIMSSITGVHGLSANVSYSTAKAGLLGLNRHIAVHYAKHGIRCNAILPGALTQTPDWNDHPNPERRKEAMEAAIPLGRLGTPSDIAPWVAFLVSDDSSFATGGSFLVDGGLTIV